MCSEHLEMCSGHFFCLFVCFSCIVSLHKCRMRTNPDPWGLAPAPACPQSCHRPGVWVALFPRLVLGHISVLSTAGPSQAVLLPWLQRTWAGSPREQLLALPGSCSSSWEDCFAFIFGFAANGCCSFPKRELEIPSSFGLFAKGKVPVLSPGCSLAQQVTRQEAGLSFRLF